MGFFDGRVARVTGGGRGIGRAVAFALADHGAAVAVSSRTSSEIDQMAVNIGGRGGRSKATYVEVSARNMVEDAVKEIEDSLGPIDVLISSALTCEGNRSIWRRSMRYVRMNHSTKVEAGQIVSIVGPNGAGKSTVFKAIFGLLPVRQGQVVFGGEEVTNHAPEALLRRGMAFVPQGRNVFPLMSVEENLLLGAYIRRRSPALLEAVERVYATFPVLRARRKARAGDLSGGQQQMLEMGRALLLQPKLILLDEPTLGLAPVVFKQIFRIIQELPPQGRTILMVEQNAAKALEISDYAYVLELGNNRYEGSGEAIRNDERVKRLYLGR